MALSPEESSKQKGEALQALADFNDGVWSGVATSFSITSDAAAGVSRRKFSAPYKTSVSTRFGFGAGDEGLKVVETFTWEEEPSNGSDGSDTGETSSSDGDNDNGFCVASRSILLGNSVDCDAEDGSYSTDVALLDLPSAISGSKGLTKFAIENCMAISDEERIRVFLLYGIDDLLSRVVICDETRVEEEKDGASRESIDIGDQSPSFDVRNPITASTSIDERMERLQEAFAASKQGGVGGDDSAATQYERYSMDLYGMSIGAWLGDTVVRDMGTGGSSNSANSGSSKGFGSPQSRPQKKKQKKSDVGDFGSGFAEWNLGVQKVSLVFKWDFEETVRQVLHFGRSIGSSTGPVPTSSMGTVNDELMSRRLPKEERMTYIDYDMSRYAGFIVGEKYIKCPRYLSFAQAESFPFYTEVSVFLREKKDENDLIIELGDEDELPDAYCTRMSRLYDKGGNFSQGSTSFFMLKPIGVAEGGE